MKSRTISSWRDLVSLFIECEMAGIEQVDLPLVLAGSRLNALAPGAVNDGSLAPQATSVGGLCSRSHACHFG